MANLNRRTFVSGGLTASALAALTACGKKSDSSAGSSAGASGAAAGGKVIKYFITNPVAIDPYNAQETQGMQVTQALFDSLTGFDWTTGDLVPKAAESWDVSDDAKVFTFHLVKDAKFHNGDPVDAASFKRGWERICDPTMTTPSVIAYHLNPIKGAVAMQEGKATEIEGVKVIDDLTLEVTLDGINTRVGTVEAWGKDGGRLSLAESAIKQNAEGISLSATKTEVEGVQAKANSAMERADDALSSATALPTLLLPMNRRTSGSCLTLSSGLRVSRTTPARRTKWGRLMKTPPR
jgi:ABC-type transport system substrate-binding protein